jgi:hypothetical protein
MNASLFQRVHGWIELSLRREHYRLLKSCPRANSVSYWSLDAGVTCMRLVSGTHRPIAITWNNGSLVTAVVIRDYIPIEKTIRTSSV